MAKASFDVNIPVEVPLLDHTGEPLLDSDGEVLTTIKIVSKTVTVNIDIESIL